MTDLKQIVDLKSELIDRFGPLPDEATNLLFKIMLKVLAKNAGVSRLDMTNHSLVLSFSQTHQKNPAALVDMIMEAPERFNLSPDYVLKVRLANNNITAHLAQTKNILKEIAQRVNG